MAQSCVTMLSVCITIAYCIHSMFCTWCKDLPGFIELVSCRKSRFGELWSSPSELAGIQSIHWEPKYIKYMSRWLGIHCNVSYPPVHPTYGFPSSLLKLLSNGRQPDRQFTETVRSSMSSFAMRSRAYYYLNKAETCHLKVTKPAIDYGGRIEDIPSKRVKSVQPVCRLTVVGSYALSCQL